MQVLSIGDRVVEGRYRIHSRFRRAVNFADDEGIVCLVAREVGAGPISIVVDRLRTAGARVLTIGTRLTPGATGPRPMVWVGDRALDCGAARVYGSDLDRIGQRMRGYRAKLHTLREALVEIAPAKSLAFLLDESRRAAFRPGFETAFAEHASNCVADILYHDILRGVTRLRGAGFGLTPSGDDFIRGLLVGMKIVEIVYGTSLSLTRRYVGESARTGGTLSDALLLLAEEGRVGERVKGLLGALVGGTFGGVRDATRALCSVGETSGADFATGLLLTLEVGPTLPVLDCDFDPLYDDVRCSAGDVMTVS